MTLPIIMDRVDTFVDAGANIGIFSCIIARRRLFQPEFRVMAFEPHPDTFVRLQANAIEWGIETYNIALGADDSRDEFVDGAVSNVFTKLDQASCYNISNERVLVNIRPLDSFCLSDRKIFLKIDVEGQEYNVLLGAIGLFESKSVVGIYFDGFSDQRVLTFLRKFNFEFFDLRQLKKCDGNVFALLAVKTDQ